MNDGRMKGECRKEMRCPAEEAEEGPAKRGISKHFGARPGGYKQIENVRHELLLHKGEKFARKFA